MQDTPGSVFILGGMFALSLVFWLIRQRQRRRGEETLARFAHQHGLTLTASGEVSGVYQQRPLQLRIELRREPRRRNGYPVTVVRFDVSDALPSEFSLKRAGAGDALADLVGGRGDEKMGAEGFDKAFSLENVSPETREVLGTTAVMESCWRLNEQRAFHIEDGWLHTEHEEVPDSTEALEELVDSVLEGPRALASAAASLRARPSVSA